MVEPTQKVTKVDMSEEYKRVHGRDPPTLTYYVYVSWDKKQGKPTASKEEFGPLVRQLYHGYSKNEKNLDWLIDWLADKVSVNTACNKNKTSFGAFHNALMIAMDASQMCTRDNCGHLLLGHHQKEDNEKVMTEHLEKAHGDAASGALNVQKHVEGFLLRKFDSYKYLENNEQMVCPICLLDFKLPGSVAQHLVVVHTDQTVLQRFGFGALSQLNLHKLPKLLSTKKAQDDTKRWSIKFNPPRAASTTNSQMTSPIIKKAKAQTGKPKQETDTDDEQQVNPIQPLPGKKVQKNKSPLNITNFIPKPESPLAQDIKKLVNEDKTRKAKTQLAQQARSKQIKSSSQSPVKDQALTNIAQLQKQCAQKGQLEVQEKKKEKQGELKRQLAEQEKKKEKQAEKRQLEEQEKKKQAEKRQLEEQEKEKEKQAEKRRLEEQEKEKEKQAEKRQLEEQEKEKEKQAEKKQLEEQEKKKQEGQKQPEMQQQEGQKQPEMQQQQEAQKQEGQKQLEVQKQQEAQKQEGQKQQQQEAPTSGQQQQPQIQTMWKLKPEAAQQQDQERREMQIDEEGQKVAPILKSSLYSSPDQEMVSGWELEIRHSSQENRTLLYPYSQLGEPFFALTDAYHLIPHYLLKSEGEQQPMDTLMQSLGQAHQGVNFGEVGHNTVLSTPFVEQYLLSLSMMIADYEARYQTPGLMIASIKNSDFVAAIKQGATRAARKLSKHLGRDERLAQETLETRYMLVMVEAVSVTRYLSTRSLTNVVVQVQGVWVSLLFDLQESQAHFVSPGQEEMSTQIWEVIGVVFKAFLELNELDDELYGFPRPNTGDKTPIKVIERWVPGISSQYYSQFSAFIPLMLWIVVLFDRPIKSLVPKPDLMYMVNGDAYMKQVTECLVLIAAKKVSDSQIDKFMDRLKGESSSQVELVQQFNTYKANREEEKEKKAKEEALKRQEEKESKAKEEALKRKEQEDALERTRQNQEAMLSKYAQPNPNATQHMQGIEESKTPGADRTNQESEGLLEKQRKAYGSYKNLIRAAEPDPSWDSHVTSVKADEYEFVTISREEPTIRLLKYNHPLKEFQAVYEQRFANKVLTDIFFHGKVSPNLIPQYVSLAQTYFGLSGHRLIVRPQVLNQFGGDAMYGGGGIEQTFLNAKALVKTHDLDKYDFVFGIYTRSLKSSINSCAVVVINKRLRLVTIIPAKPLGRDGFAAVWIDNLIIGLGDSDNDETWQYEVYELYGMHRCKQGVGLCLNFFNVCYHNGVPPKRQVFIEEYLKRFKIYLTHQLGRGIWEVPDPQKWDLWYKENSLGINYFRSRLGEQLGQRVLETQQRQSSVSPQQEPIIILSDNEEGAEGKVGNDQDEWMDGQQESRDFWGCTKSQEEDDDMESPNQSNRSERSSSAEKSEQKKPSDGDHASNEEKK